MKHSRKRKDLHAMVQTSGDPSDGAPGRPRNVSFFFAIFYIFRFLFFFVLFVIFLFFEVF